MPAGILDLPSSLPPKETLEAALKEAKLCGIPLLIFLSIEQEKDFQFNEKLFIYDVNDHLVSRRPQPPTEFTRKATSRIDSNDPFIYSSVADDKICIFDFLSAKIASIGEIQRSDSSSRTLKKVSSSTTTKIVEEVIYVTLKGAKEHGKQGKNAWKDSMHKGIEEAICHHPFLSKLKNLVLVVSDVSGQTVRALVSQLEIRPTQGHVENSWKIVASKEQICGLLNAPTTTRKLVEKMIDAINEMGAKGKDVAVGSYEEHVYKLVH